MLIIPEPREWRRQESHFEASFSYMGLWGGFDLSAATKKEPMLGADKRVQQLQGLASQLV